MLVRQLMGPYAGQIMEMPYAVAQNCIAAGTACLPDDHRAAASVKGLVIVEPVTEIVVDPVVEVSSAEEDTVIEEAPVTHRRGRRKSG